jgi:hypothetical protein
VYNQEQMNKALRAFEWKAVLELLPDYSSGALQDLLSDVSRSGCLIRVYALPLERDELRLEMIEQIRLLCLEIGGSSWLEFFGSMLNQVEITELALAEIDGSLNQDDYTTLSPADQAWSLLTWAAGESLDVHRQMFEALENYRTGDGIVLDPLHFRLDKKHGYGSAVGRIHQISRTVANTLRMLGHRNGWSSTGRFAIPARIYPDATEISAAQRISRLGDYWEAVLDESEHHRFWGGHFVVNDADAEQKEFCPGLEHVIVGVKTKPERRDDCQIAEYIARNRMQRSEASAYRSITRSDAKKRVKNPRQGNVALAPKGLVSELEMVTLYVLDVILHFNPVKSTTEFGGLTILEWLRGYCVLEACYTENEPSTSGGLVEIGHEEFCATLVRGGLSLSKAKVFLERATFQSGRRDLYDAPLIPSQDDRLYFFEALYHGVDIAVIISSQIGSQKLNVATKGAAFEKAVLKMFVDGGIPARTFKFTIRDEHENTDKGYECDVAVLWDRRLFIIECKNYGLPTADPADRLYFWQKQAEAMLQVERIARDLNDHPEILRQHFGEDAGWDHVHPVVLNASFLSLQRSPRGTFFYDASALARFLEEGTLNAIRSIPIDGSQVQVSEEVKRLWKGPRPTAEDLVAEMSFPSQVEMERDKYYIARKLMPLSPTVGVMITEAASKPPNFEPVSLAKEMHGAEENSETIDDP